MLESLANRKSEIKVRKANINRPEVQGIDFQSPLAQQYVKGGVPYFQIYDPNGQVIAEGFEQGTEQIMKWCQEAGITDDELRKAGVIR